MTKQQITKEAFALKSKEEQAQYRQITEYDGWDKPYTAYERITPEPTGFKVGDWVIIKNNNQTESYYAGHYPREIERDELVGTVHLIERITSPGDYFIGDFYWPLTALDPAPEHQVEDVSHICGYGKDCDCDGPCIWEIQPKKVFDPAPESDKPETDENGPYIVINMVTAIPVSENFYTKAEANEICSKNWLGTYAAVTVFDHIKSLLTWYRPDLELRKDPAPVEGEQERVERSLQDATLDEVERLGNIHKQLPEKAFLFGSLFGANWQKQQDASLLSAQQSRIEQLEREINQLKNR